MCELSKEDGQSLKLEAKTFFRTLKDNILFIRLRTFGVVWPVILGPESR